MFAELDLSGWNTERLHDFTYAFTPLFLRSYVRTIRMQLSVNAFHPGAARRCRVLCAIINPSQLVITLAYKDVGVPFGEQFNSPEHQELSRKKSAGLKEHVLELLVLPQDVKADLRFVFTDLWDGAASYRIMEEAVALISRVPITALHCLGIRTEYLFGERLHASLQSALDTCQQRFNITAPRIAQYGDWLVYPCTVPLRSELRPVKRIQENAGDPPPGLLTSFAFDPHRNWSIPFRLTLTHLHVGESDIGSIRDDTPSIELQHLTSLKLDASTTQRLCIYLRCIVMPSLRHVDISISHGCSSSFYDTLSARLALCSALRHVQMSVAEPPKYSQPFRTFAHTVQSTGKFDFVIRTSGVNDAHLRALSASASYITELHMRLVNFNLGQLPDLTARLTALDFGHLKYLSITWPPTRDFTSRMMVATAFWNAVNCLLLLNKLPSLASLQVAGYLHSTTTLLNLAYLLYYPRLAELHSLSLRFRNGDPEFFKKGHYKSSLRYGRPASCASSCHGRLSFCAVSCK